MLSKEETNHYQRHLSLPGFGMKGQLRLKNSSALVVGAGGLGCPILQYLAAVGVGKVGIVDDDIVDASNLQRQILFNYNDIGKPKVKAAKEKLEAINPNIDIIEFLDRIDSQNAEQLINGFDVIVDGTDNFVSRYLINDACVILKKTLIYGAIHGFEGQVSVFNFENGPTYRCLYPTPPKTGALPACSENGVLGVLPGIIGNFQALETIKVITGIGEKLSGKILLYDALKQKTRIVKLKKTKQASEITSLKNLTLSCTRNQIKMTENLLKEISPLAAQDIIEDVDNYIFLDVRENWERAISKISPSIHIPLQELLSRSSSKLHEEISDQKNLIVYCKAGIRSLTACKSLHSHGFKNLYNLSGGVLKWEQEGLPLE